MSSILPKTNKNKSTCVRYHSSKVKFLRRFLGGELKMPKRHFEVNWPLEMYRKLYTTSWNFWPQCVCYRKAFAREKLMWTNLLCPFYFIFLSGWWPLAKEQWNFFPFDIEMRGSRAYIPSFNFVPKIHKK